ncbi:MAG: DUF1800 family protein [Pseudomonadota bacterium]
MQKRFDRINLVSSAAVIALIAGGGMAAAQDSGEGVNAERFLSIARALQSEAAAAPAPAEPTEETGGLFRKITVASQGVFRFEAPAGSGMELLVNGEVAIDTTAPSTAGGSVTALQTLTAGEHAIQIKLLGGRLPGVSFGQIGSEPSDLVDVSQQVTVREGLALALRNSAIGSAAPSAPASPQPPAAQQGGNNLPGLAGNIGFSLGGRSSGAAAPTPPSSGAAAPEEEENVSPLRGGLLAALAPKSQANAPAMAPSGGGGAPSVPAPSTGGNSGQPSSIADLLRPNPTPVPTPTPVNPGSVPTAETVQASPLSPPANVELTQAVQLTSAGNVNSQVPNTGATLFGAVQSSSVFDTVDVQISGSNRSTTVDVGPMTGQFAVRLFPEDFGAGNQVQVTLTGANSTNTEVEATPVTYTLTAMPAQDGVSQALSRLTYGATPDLYARVRSIGFANYVEEQLNPDSINDAAFNAMNPNAILTPTERNGNTLLRNLVHYEIANAAFSEKQLQNVMGDFWANHFHAVTKDTNMYAQNINDRQYFHDNAFGTFQDLLLYSARSPLMSQYLDNDQNRFRENRENEGINENYGREILELSTVGVEAGYTPADVDMVSRVFSGWRYTRTNPNADNVAETYAFEFFPEDHDPQDKLIPFLGTTIAGREGADGVQEGEELISILANHPSTINRTCRKIVQLLVADNAPDGFIQACVAAWGVDGDIDAMLRAILLNPAYINTAEYQRNKAKTPFEYSVSVIRAFGARPDNPQEDDFWNRFREAHEDAGYNFVRFPVPTGLPEVSAAWLNSASMVAAYNEITDVVERRQDYGIDLMADIAEAGLETAEEVAAYLLAIGTADNFTLPEYEEVVGVLKGEDGIFEPRVQDETRALERAMGLIVVSPSFQLQ